MLEYIATAQLNGQRDICWTTSHKMFLLILKVLLVCVGHRLAVQCLGRSCWLFEMFRVPPRRMIWCLVSVLLLIMSFVCLTKGRHVLFTLGGKTPPREMFISGCIFVDHALGYVWIEFQPHLNLHETLCAKKAFTIHC